jgi:hypothetical protein
MKSQGSNPEIKRAELVASLPLQRDGSEQTQTIWTKETLQEELYKSMAKDALAFAGVMLDNDAWTQNATVSQKLPRKFPLYRAKSEDVVAPFWVIRDHHQTNYGGFPLFLSYDGGRTSDMDARSRIVIVPNGQIDVLTSLGHDNFFFEPKDNLSTERLISRVGLRNMFAANQLYSEWREDLVTAGLHYLDNTADAAPLID